MAFFCYDIQKNKTDPYSVFLYGKLPNGDTCCILVSNIQSKVYVVAEDSAIAVMQKIGLSSWTQSKVTRTITFGPGAPLTREFVELKISQKHPKLGILASYGEGIGWSQTALQQFMLDKRIRIPCWLEIDNLEDQKVRHWCRRGLKCQARDVHVSEPTITDHFRHRVKGIIFNDYELTDSVGSAPAQNRGRVWRAKSIDGL